MGQDWRAFAASLLPRCPFPPTGAVVSCAVSGGPDSVALLLLAVAHGCRATAIHVDHGLRDGSADEAKLVHRLAADLGAGFEAHRVHVSAGPNLEARARIARYQALPHDALLGHTTDDQAETVLLHLLRGAGLPGLSALSDQRRRPILDLRRTETEALCRSAAITPIRDPMNHDRRFSRVRVRHEILPLLTDVAQRDMAVVLRRQARLLADDDALLEDLAAMIDPTDAKALAAAASPLARRAVRAWLLRTGVGDGHPPGLAVVERILHVAAGRAASADLFEGWRVARTRQRLRLVAPHGVRPAPADR